MSDTPNVNPPSSYQNTVESNLWLALTVATGEPHDLPPYRPAPEQPGTLAEQFQVIDVYLDDPTRSYDPDGAWELARRLVLPHARRPAK